MAMRSRDLTLELDNKRLNILTWSSDPIYTVANKLIRTTIDNTVQDLIEVICQRSYEEGGDINPLAVNLSYTIHNLRNSDPLSTVFENELISSEPIRLRVEFDKSKLTAKQIAPCLFNVNLTMSNGKVLRLSESLNTTVESLKYTIVDDLHMDIGLSDITGLEFNGGINVCSDNASTIGELLQLDTVPFGDLHFYVTLTSDLRIRLSSPMESILRTNYMSVSLDTTIFTVKKYILDQYSGINPHVTTGDIRIIYFGRLLTDDIRIRNITSPSSTNMIVLHFSLEEREEAEKSVGFWNDLKNGKIFDFYPREPNPHFAIESQRIQRLREQFRNSGQADEPTTIDRAQGVFVQEYNPTTRVLHAEEEELEAEVEEEEEDDDEQQQQPTRTIALPHVEAPPAHLIPPMAPLETHEDSDMRPSVEEEEDRHFLRTHRLPEGSYRTGDSFDLIEQNGERVLINQVDSHDTAYMITVQTPNGPREVMLSSSQAMINDTIPGKPYLMVSHSGYARLQQLGVEISEPACQRETLPQVEELNQQGNNIPEIREEPAAPGEANLMRFELFLDFNQIRPEALIRLLSTTVSYVIIYYLFIQTNLTGFYHNAAVAGLVIWGILSQVTGNAAGLILRTIGNFLNRRFGITRENVETRTKQYAKRILEFGTSTAGVGPAQRAFRGSLLDFVLFLTSLSPGLHNMFVTSLAEMLEERRVERAELLARLEEINARIEVIDTIDDANDPEPEEMQALDGNSTGVNLHPQL